MVFWKKQMGGFLPNNGHSKQLLFQTSLIDLTTVMSVVERDRKLVSYTENASISNDAIRYDCISYYSRWQIPGQSVKRGISIIEAANQR